VKISDKGLAWQVIHSSSFKSLSHFRIGKAQVRGEGFATPIRVDVTGEENGVLDLPLTLMALSQSKTQDFESEVLLILESAMRDLNK
jgi:hypothetical protein